MTSLFDPIIFLFYHGVVMIFLGASSIILSIISAILKGLPTKPSIPAERTAHEGDVSTARASDRSIAT
jgi:hypothetical protein